MSWGLRLRNPANGAVVLDTSTFTGQHVGTLTINGTSALTYFTVPDVPASTGIWFFSVYLNATFDQYEAVAGVDPSNPNRIYYEILRAPSGAITRIYYGWR